MRVLILFLSTLLLLTDPGLAETFTARWSEKPGLAETQSYTYADSVDRYLIGEVSRIIGVIEAGDGTESNMVEGTSTQFIFRANPRTSLRWIRLRGIPVDGGICLRIA